MRSLLSKRLPIITRTIIFFYSVFTFQFLIYNTQCAINLFGKTENFYDLSPIVLMLELLIELMISGFILTAICFA